MGVVCKPHIYGSTIWASIKHSYGVVHGACQWVPDAASQLLFWFDNQLGQVIAKKIDLLIALYKDLRVPISEYWGDDRQDLPPDFECGYLQVYADIMRVRLMSVDTFVAWVSSSRVLTNAATYDLIRNEALKVAWNRVILRHFIPHSWSFLFQRLMYGKMPMNGVLQCHGFSLAFACAFCHSEVEFVDNLFLHCNLARALWQALVSCFC